MRLLDMEQHGAPRSLRVQAGRLASPQRLTTAPRDNPDPLRLTPTWNGNERTDPQINCTASAAASLGRLTARVGPYTLYAYVLARLHRRHVHRLPGPVRRESSCERGTYHRRLYYLRPVCPGPTSRAHGPTPESHDRLRTSRATAGRHGCSRLS